MFVRPWSRLDIFSPEVVVNNGEGIGTMKGTGMAMGKGMGTEKELLEAFGKHKQRCSHDFEYFCSKELLVDRKGGGNPVPFLFNRAQKYVWTRLEEQWTREGMIRANILKGRQQGMSTLVAALIFWKAVTNRCLNATLVSKDLRGCVHRGRIGSRGWFRLLGAQRPVHHHNRGGHWVVIYRTGGWVAQSHYDTD
jgi:hypothetical protein